MINWALISGLWIVGAVLRQLVTLGTDFDERRAIRVAWDVVWLGGLIWMAAIAFIAAWHWKAT